MAERHAAPGSDAVAAAETKLLSGAAQRRAESLLGALCEPSRLRIVQALRAAPLTVTDLAKVISKSRAATSQHLKVLRDVRAVSADRRGQYVVYSLSEDVSAEILHRCANAFDQLRPSA